MPSRAGKIFCQLLPTGLQKGRFILVRARGSGERQLSESAVRFSEQKKPFGIGEKSLCHSKTSFFNDLMQAVFLNLRKKQR